MHLIIYAILFILAAPFIVLGFIVYGLVEAIRILIEKDDNDGFPA